MPIIKQFAARHGLSDFVVVPDAGMLSATNLADLDEARFRFVVGSRSTKAPVDLASHFGWHGEVFTDGQIIDTISPKSRRAPKVPRTTRPNEPNRSGTQPCTRPDPNDPCGD